MTETVFTSSDPSVNPPGEPEAEIVRRAISDPQAFGPLYELYYSRMLSYAYRCTGSVSAAEEVTSSTFFKALRGLKSYRGKSPFSCWIYRIATNELRMYWRSGRTSQFQTRWQEDVARIYFDLHAPSGDASDQLAEFARLHAALALLPEKYRVPLTLRYFEGMPIELIGTTLGKRTGTVKSLLHRGLDRLKRILLAGNATTAASSHLHLRQQQ